MKKCPKFSPEELEKRCEVSRRENRRKEARAMARAPGQIRKVEEKKKRDRERKAGQNWGRPIVWAQEMKEAEVNPVPSKVFKGAFHSLAQVENLMEMQKNRRQTRRLRGERAELDFDQARSVVQSSSRGLRETVNLEQRLQLLRRSMTKDCQCITTSLLAKTLAFRGEMEGAKEEMRRWRQFTVLGGREKTVERRRWREASTKLNLFLAQRKNALADLRKEEWKKVKQEGASPRDIKEFVKDSLLHSHWSRNVEDWLSLVEECRGLALIGRELHTDATPALLCHKEPARASKAPY